MKVICLLTALAVFTGFAYELNHYRNQFSFYQDRGFDRIRKADAFNLERLSNGIYWVVLKSGDEIRTRKMVLIK